MYQSDRGAALEWGTRQLLAAGGLHIEVASEAAREASVLLAAATGTSRAVLLAFPERALHPDERARYADWIARRARGEPVAYLTGRREFWSLELEVTPDVLVPRPETELLVERALTLRDTLPTQALDLGTGSGAIALALARERPDWRITASDCAPAALAVARRNAARLGIGGIEFVLGAWFDAIGNRRFDLLLSNPPYVRADDPALERAPLRYEPRVALAAGPDGLAALALIIAAAPRHLEPEGWLLLEHGADQGATVADLLVANGFRHVGSRRDLAGRERVTEARWLGR